MSKPKARYFDAHVTCRALGTHGATEPMVFFIIQHDALQPTIEDVVRRVTVLGYEQIIVKEILETNDPSNKRS